MTEVLGIDVSNNNGTDIDWKRVGRAKVDGHQVEFVFFKVNEGDLIDQTTSRARVQAARDAGLLVGGYNFVRPRPGRAGWQEFDIFYKRAREVGLLRPGRAERGDGYRVGDLVPVIDIEATGFTGPTGPLRTRRYVQSWIRRCVKRTGRAPIVYTGQWFWDGVMHGDAKGLKKARLWLAAYTKDFHPFVPRAWSHASFWQSTDKGQVPGVPGHVDINHYLSDRRHLVHGYTL